uniref:PPM-type phosphatase domain-containing protein n=1 Tax=viral metagenome TaxID=1070528 RepID=A0A6C0CJ74_9ZZZZ
MDAKRENYDFAFGKGMWYDVGTGDILTPESAALLVSQRKRVSTPRLRIVGTYAKQLRNFEMNLSVSKSDNMKVNIIDRWNDTHMVVTMKNERGYYKLTSLLESAQIPVNLYALSTGQSLVVERKHRANVFQALNSVGTEISYQNREVAEQDWRNSRIQTYEHQVSRKGQDRFFQLSQDGVIISLLFDGHGNNNTIEYITTHHSRFAELGARPFPETNAEAFERAQRIFINFENRLRKEVDAMYSGSTIVVAVHDLVSKNVFFAYAGDSRAIWQFETNSKVFGTKDHKPIDPEEKDRVEALGGRITRTKGDAWRVNDHLSTSRSFGDESLKSTGDDRTKDLVSVIPSVDGPFIFGPGSFYGMGSDGVFDVLSNEQVAKIIVESRGSQNGAQLVTQAAVEARSYDDITFAYLMVL